VNVHSDSFRIDQVPPDNVPYNSDSEDDMDEDAYDLREVSSDVEINPDDAELDSDDDDDDDAVYAHLVSFYSYLSFIMLFFSRFEEIHDKNESLSLKRPRESDTMDTEPLSKSAQKKLNKKLKAEGGKAVATGSGDEEKKSKKEKKKEKKEQKEEGKAQKNGVEGDEKAKKGSEKEKKAGAVKILEGGIKVEDKTVGTGAQAKKGNTVSMRYIGKLPNEKIFDQNTKGKPVSATAFLLLLHSHFVLVCISPWTR
jgi:FK506-binding nuclear protein